MSPIFAKMSVAIRTLSIREVAGHGRDADDPNLGLQFTVIMEAAAEVSRGTSQEIAILVGGGPAPGINSVIGAATIRAALEGMDVVGIRDGFEG